MGPGGWNRRRWLGLALDVAMVATIAATFAQLTDPDLLFHVVWVLLTAQAFLFGIRVAGSRLVVAVGSLVSYSWVAAMGPIAPLDLTPLELTEWPLMVIIAALVAIMADGQRSTAVRYANLYRNASERLLSAQEDERRRLARDLHDGVGQTLTAASLALDDLGSRLAAGASSAALEPLDRSRTLVGIALEETRDVAVRLRPSRLTEAGVARAINELADHAGIAVSVEIAPSLLRPGILEPSREIEVFRIVQESLGNIARHAGPCRAVVSMTERDGRLVVRIEDDGVGFVVGSAVERGLGLPSMRERASAVGATLGIRSTPGSGTTIRLSVPGLLPAPAGGGSHDTPAEALELGWPVDGRARP